MKVKNFVKTDSRGQGAIEFILICGFVLFALVVLIGSYSNLVAARGGSVNKNGNMANNELCSTVEKAMKSEDLCTPKVTICHYPPGNPGNSNTISVSENAVSAHLAHGDTRGACSQYKVGKFYAVSSGKIISIDPETAAVETVLQLSGVACGSTALAFSPSGRIFSYCNKYKQLMEINPDTGERTLIGPPSAFKWINGLALIDEDTLYGLHGPTESLVKINMNTGEVEVVGDLGDIRNNGLAVDFRTKEIYAVSGRGKNQDVILKIDVETGTATEVGSLGVTWGSVGTEFHPITGELYAVRSGNILKKINRETGEVTTMGILGNGARTVSLASPHWSPFE